MAAPGKASMHIDFRIDGGIAAFPGLAQPVRIDCAALPERDAMRLQDLVRRADFFGAREPVAAAPVPDARAYTIVVDDGLQCRTLTLAEPIADGPMRELVTELRLRANAMRGRGGAT
ncbi:MAG TPA: protealysin inhibitor emfourin [Casimicrobiaceae bacterium]|nr:protealysin inhibitor emfourin [Casimicrobiaceae bacterium]